MAISTRREILSALKTCLEGITTDNDYQVTVAEVKRGIHFVDDMRNRPGLCFWSDKGPRRDETNEQSERDLHIWIWGYVDVQPGNYDELDKLVADVETRLMTRSAWAYRDDTKIGELNTYEGGASDPVGVFEMEVTVNYEYRMDSP